jgi:hypothetical protein
MQESERTTSAPNPCTRMLNSVGGISYICYVHSLLHVLNLIEPNSDTHLLYGRFRMRRHVFERLVDVVQQVDPYFIQRPNCAGEIGLSALQKVVAGVHIVAYRIPVDAVDKYVCIGVSITHEALKHFCTAIQTVFGAYYLRAPNAADIARLLQVGESLWFPAMLGSVDCMHWEWHNYPSAWKGMFTGRSKHPSMILEAVASYDLWIWYAYFGMTGSCNDINVLHRSNLFERHLSGDTPPVSFSVNGHTYNMGYYLAERNIFVNQRYNQLKDRNKYTQLQVDLIHHHWVRLGSGIA